MELNSCAATQLIDELQLDAAMAERIVEHRPYGSLEEVMEASWRKEVDGVVEGIS